MEDNLHRLPFWGPHWDGGEILPIEGTEGGDKEENGGRGRGAGWYSMPLPRPVPSVALGISFVASNAAEPAVDQISKRRHCGGV